MTRTQEFYERFDSGATRVEGQQPTAQQQSVPQQPTAVIPSSREPKPRERYKNKVFGIGIAECIMGGLAIIFGIATISMKFPYSRYIYVGLTYVSQGIWAGAFVVITGILGACTKAKPSVGMYNANMTFSIITAVCSGVGTVLSGVAAADAQRVHQTLYALHVLITICLLGGFISSIVHSAFCCGAVCGRRYQHPGTVVYIPQVPQQQQIGGIPTVQYVVPAGTRMPTQGYFVMSPAAVNTNVPAVPPYQVGQQFVTNVQTVPQTSNSAMAPSTVVDGPPGYSTLPKQ